jgi:hypothetical protein
MKITTCVHCGRSFVPNPRVKNQKYCQDVKCQRARRARWYSEKMVKDPDYRDNQRRCQKEWQLAHPSYYTDYRAKHPEYVRRNRLLQMRRDAKRRKDRVGKFLANIDSLCRWNYSRKGALFRLVPQGDRFLANIDSLIVKIIPVNML